MELQYSVSIIWGDDALDAPSVEEVALLLSEVEDILQEMRASADEDDE